MARIRQFGTINMLVEGLMDGVFRLDEVVLPDEIGLGTFAAIDGEMVVLEGACYQARFDGTVKAAAEHASTPYVTLGSFEAPRQVECSELVGFDALCCWLDARLSNLNRPSMVRIDGRFRHVKARSVRPQSPPYPGLAAVAEDQVIFEWPLVEGAIVGFRFPEYLQSVQVAGWHLHVLDSEHLRAGHLLELDIEYARATIESAPCIEITLPDDPAFREASLPVDVHAAVQGAERAPASG